MKHIKKLEHFEIDGIEGIPTAEQLYFAEYGTEIRSNDKYLMIEFAKMHVEAALEAAYNNVEIVRGKKTLDKYDYADSSHYTADKNSIIRAYPESNIK